VSSGHNANRGRNGSNNSGTGSNGGNNRRARRTLSHQRIPTSQSLLQHRADTTSAPTRVSEVSESLVQEESAPTADDRMDPSVRQAEALGVPVGPGPVPPVAGGPTTGDEDPPQPAVYPDRLDPSTDQPRPNRRSPQLIPSAPSVSSEVQPARDSALVLNSSIRAPFAPGHNHLPPGNNLQSPFPPSVTGRAVSSGRNGAAIPPRRREEGTPPFSGSTWESTPAKQANDGSEEKWPHLPSVTERIGNPSRDPVSHQEQGPTEGPVFFESRDVRGDIGELIDSLHEAFERDRGIASQGDSARCGICYLHYFLGELQYRDEEGYYVCASCARALSHTRILMVRRQQRL
jgi:hypothetical protein